MPRCRRGFLLASRIRLSDGPEWGLVLTFLGSVEPSAGEGAHGGSRSLVGDVLRVDVAALSAARVGGAAIFTGSMAMFRAAGFTEVARTYPSRPVMRLLV